MPAARYCGGRCKRNKISSTSPGNWLEIQMIRIHPRPEESASAFNKHLMQHEGKNRWSSDSGAVVLELCRPFESPAIFRTIPGARMHPIRTKEGFMGLGLGKALKTNGKNNKNKPTWSWGTAVTSFLKLSGVYTSPMALAKMQILIQEVWDGAWESAFPTSSYVPLMRLYVSCVLCHA